MTKFMGRKQNMNLSTARCTQDKSVSLRSRVPGNWQARFWRPVKRGDPLAEFNQPQGDHLTGPEVGLGVFGMSCSCSSTSQNKAVIKSMVVMGSPCLAGF